MGKKDQLSGTLDLLILKTLAQAGPIHGYGIVLYIQRVTDDLLRVEEGSLYPALHRIEQTGWIASEWRTTETKRQARFYKLTAAGRRQLVEEEANWRRVMQGVDRFLKLA